MQVDVLSHLVEYFIITDVKDDISWTLPWAEWWPRSGVACVIALLNFGNNDPCYEWVDSICFSKNREKQSLPHSSISWKYSSKYGELYKIWRNKWKMCKGNWINGKDLAESTQNWKVAIKSSKRISIPKGIDIFSHFQTSKGTMWKKVNASYFGLPLHQRNVLWPHSPRH